MPARAYQPGNALKENSLYVVSLPCLSLPPQNRGLTSSRPFDYWASLWVSFCDHPKRKGNMCNLLLRYWMYQKLAKSNAQSGLHREQDNFQPFFNCCMSQRRSKKFGHGIGDFRNFGLNGCHLRRILSSSYVQRDCPAEFKTKLTFSRTTFPT